MSEERFIGGIDPWAAPAADRPWSAAAPPPFADAELPIATPAFIAALGDALDSLAYRDAEREGGADVVDVEPSDDGGEIEMADYVTGAAAAGVARIEPEIAVGALPSPRRLPFALDGAAIVCTLLGFFAGAFAWHMVGFWSLVSAVAFNGDARDAQPPAFAQRAIDASPPKSSDIVTGSIRDRATAPTEGCVAIAIDRNAGGIVHQPCAAATLPLRDAGRQARRDRGPDAADSAGNPNSWMSTTGPTETPAPAIDEAAFDLEFSAGPVIVTPPSAAAPPATTLEP